MEVYGETLTSRLFLGTAQYPSPAVLQAAIRTSGTDLVTVSLRREAANGSGAGFWDLLRETGVRILPNTAGCHTAPGRNHHGANGAGGLWHRLDQA